MGVGEGGLIICDKASEAAFRNIINFGLNMLPQSRHYSGNFKLSDLSAAAIIDNSRLWNTGRFLRKTAAPPTSLVSNSDLPISNLVGKRSRRCPELIRLLSQTSLRNAEWSSYSKKYYTPLEVSTILPAPQKTPITSLVEYCARRMHHICAWQVMTPSGSTTLNLPVKTHFIRSKDIVEINKPR